MPGAGIEPARLAAGDFESPASTNFTTRAMNPSACAQGFRSNWFGAFFKCAERSITWSLHPPARHADVPAAAREERDYGGKASARQAPCRVRSPTHIFFLINPSWTKPPIWTRGARNGSDQQANALVAQIDKPPVLDLTHHARALVEADVILRAHIDDPVGHHKLMRLLELIAQRGPEGPGAR